MGINVEDLGLAEIKELRKQLLMRQGDIQQVETDKYIEEVRELAEKRGLDFAQIFKVLIKKPRIPKPAMYRDPETGKEWHGQGKPVKWVRDWIEQNGEDLADLLINKDEDSDKPESEKSEENEENQKSKKPKKQKA